MTRERFERLAQSVLDGTCTPEEFAQVEEALQQSPEMRRLFREAALIEEMLSLKAAELYPPLPQRVVPIDLVLKRQRKRMVTFALAGAAAVLLMAAVVMSILAIRPPSAMATLKLAPHSDYGVIVGDSEGPRSDGLEAGDEIVLKAGTLELELSSGAKAIVQGPAQLLLVDERTLSMNHGTGYFEARGKAAGFRVITPRLEAVDLGTAFGLSVYRDPEILPEAHVFEGKVQVTARDGLRRSQTLLQGEAVEVGPVGRLIKIPVAPEDFQTTLPDDLPFLHFSFDDASDGNLKAEGTHPAVSELKLRLKGSSATPAPGRQGMGLNFDGGSQPVTSSWDGILGSRSRTICAWVRQPKGLPARQFQTIVGWGNTDPDKAGKTELLLYQRKAGEATALRLSFTTLYATGVTDLADGEWHHVAAVYHEPSSDVEKPRIELFVDGQPEPINSSLSGAMAEGERPLTTKALPLMIGCLTPQPAPDRGIRGDIDEIYLFESALDPERIRRMAELKR